MRRALLDDNADRNEPAKKANVYDGRHTDAEGYPERADATNVLVIGEFFD